MIITNSVYNKMLKLLQMSFECNAIADNLAYNLDYANYKQMSDLYHSKVAHAFPELADEISTFLAKVGARAVRLPLADHSEMISAVVTIFEKNKQMVYDYRNCIISALEEAEDSEEYETKIFLEGFLERFLVYIKQADFWVAKAKEYEGNEKQFDIHFTQLTPFI